MGDASLIPQNAKNLLDRLVEDTHAILGDDLLGIYVHGSLAMGCFRWESSDIDVLAVVREKIPVEKKRELGHMLLDVSKDAPPKGIEISFMTRASLQDFEYPTPFELHFSNSNKRDFESETVNFEVTKTDPDLAGHIVITKERGITIYGEPIDAVFPDIPREFYLQSIAHDSEESFGNVMSGPDSGTCLVPNYAVLNFCRVLAARNGITTSKPEGGQWGLDNLPQEYTPIIQAALTEYATAGSSQPVQAALLKRFAQFAWRTARSRSRSPRDLRLLIFEVLAATKSPTPLRAGDQKSLVSR